MGPPIGPGIGPPIGPPGIPGIGPGGRGAGIPGIAPGPPTLGPDWGMPIPYGDGVPPDGRPPGWSAELSAIMVFITAMSPPGFAGVVSSAPHPRQNL
jgi:hypothetical protein